MLGPVPAPRYAAAGWMCRSSTKLTTCKSIITGTQENSHKTGWWCSAVQWRCRCMVGAAAGRCGAARGAPAGGTGAPAGSTCRCTGAPACTALQGRARTVHLFRCTAAHGGEPRKTASLQSSSRAFLHSFFDSSGLCQLNSSLGTVHRRTR